ncbi:MULTISPECIES: hypothetical protein [Xenophilus]|uniref:hypothetical protein n=1 Tax=Xenophilus TaxID=151754 RepID=UPI00056FC1D4|nr:hypothetical protein [Xenophilus azovorans]
MNTKVKAPPIRRDWLSKSIAGTLLGFTLAVAVSGLLDLATQALPLATRGQLSMWLVPPVWFGVLSLCFLFGSGARAWLWLGAANAAVFGLWAALRFI